MRTRLMVLAVVGMLVWAGSAQTATVLSDAELATVTGGEEEYFDCEEYACSAPGSCFYDTYWHLCVYKQVRQGYHCVDGGPYHTCVDVTTPNDCYRLGTHTPAQPPYPCRVYCAYPEYTDWDWGDWTGTREHDCNAM